MINLIISEKLKNILRDKIVIGCIQASVSVKEFNEKLWEEICTACDKIAEENSLEDVLKIEGIKTGREAYRKLGQDPSRYRISSESLIRRVVKGNGLYKVNNIVDINNLVSILSFCPVCAYDLDKIGSDVSLNVGEEGDSYEGIGRGKINLSKIPVFVDKEGMFGSTTSDSIRAMVTEDTKRLILCIVSFNGDENLEQHMEYCKDLLIKYAEGKDIEMNIVR